MIAHPSLFGSKMQFFTTIFLCFVAMTLTPAEATELCSGNRENPEFSHLDRPVFGPLSSNATLTALNTNRNFKAFSLFLGNNEHQQIIELADLLVGGYSPEIDPSITQNFQASIPDYIPGFQVFRAVPPDYERSRGEIFWRGQSFPYLIDAVKQAELKSCNEAAKELNSYLGVISNASSISTELACVLLDFDKKCLSAAAQFPVNGADSDSAVRAATVILFDHDTPVCMGILSPNAEQTEIKLLTARHCFASLETGQAKRSRFPTRGVSLDGMSYFNIPLGTPTSLAKEEAFPVTKDAISIRLTGFTPTTALPTIKLVQQPAPTIINIPGVSAHLLRAMELERAVKTNPDNLVVPNLPATQALRFSKYISNEARIVKVADGCLEHGAHALPGFSGSPVISDVYQDESGKSHIEIVALHSGAPGQQLSAGWQKCPNGNLFPEKNFADMEIEQ